MTVVGSFDNKMTFETDYLIQGQKGAVGVIQVQNPPLLSQLFTGVPQFYPGSLVQIQEVMTIVTNIYEPALVDVDYRWFSSREYRGTYQVINALGIPSFDEGDQGQIFQTIQQINRYSWYTITANPDTVVAKHEQMSFDNCNFYLQPEVYLFPGTNTPVAGFRTTPDLNPAFLGSSTISKAPLIDQPFNQKITGVGLFLYAGIEGVRVSYKAGVINTIRTDYEQAEVPKCVFLGEPSCQQKFNSFVVAGGYQYAPVDGVIYDSDAACQAQHPGLCTPQTYVCPTDPTQTFSYWIATPT